jgi:hypothetical protein
MDRQGVCRQRVGVTPDPQVPEEKKIDAEKLPSVTEAKPDVAANQLTPEQQMEAFAEELKEKDWGHQPC